MKRRSMLVVLCAILAVTAMAQEPARKKHVGAFGFFLDNDLFAGTDRGYSNGVRFVWVSPDAGGRVSDFALPGWLEFLSRMVSPLRTPGSRRFVSAYFGQNIYTPNDIERFDLVAWDRPYAGFTYAGLGFHRIGRSSMDTVALELGIVGPLSLGGDIQKFVHSLFGFRPPNGWAHQLKNEAILGIACDRYWKAWPEKKSGGSGSDLIIHAGGELSNAVSRASAGLEMRMSWNMPEEFGTAVARPGSERSWPAANDGRQLSGSGRFGLQAFFALEGHAVLRDIFLDGNSFRQSHRVEKNPLVADIVLGVALRLKRFKLGYGYVYQTRQFKTQTRNPVFGSLRIAFDILD